MVKRVLYIFVILWSCTELFAQDIANDSILIRNFGPSDYRASISNSSSVEDENGIIYFANENGVLEYDGSEWRLIRLRNYSDVVTLKSSPDGKIYVGGVNEFGYLDRDSSGQFEYHSLRELIDPNVKFHEVWQIVFFENQVYFQSYETLIRFDGENGHLIPITDSWIVPFNNQIYVSTYNKGIGVLNVDSVTYLGETLKFKDDGPFKLIPGPEGKQLVLTEYNGIFLLDTTDFSYEKWDAEANSDLIKYGLYDGMVWNDSTYLFSRTDNGIVWVNFKGQTLRVINKENGLSTNYMRELLRDRRGNLWIPSDGLNYLSFPNQQKDEGFNTIMRYVEVNDSAIYINTTNGEIPTNAFTNSLVFHFATPGYDKSDLEYSYYLEGYEKEWSAWKADVKKEYTNLGNRSYIFHVKARLANGKVSSPAVVQFSIPAHWYESFWTFFFGIIILVVIIWVSLRLRMSHLKSLNDELEKIIDNRTKELVQQKEQLHSTNEELIVANAELDNFVYRSSHDLIAPLKSLKGLINITQLEQSEEERQKYFQLMNTSVVRLEEFIQSILEYSSNSKSGVIKKNINLNEILDSVVQDLKYFPLAEKVELRRHFDEKTIFRSDPKRVKIILNNLIANAVKYHNYDQPTPYIEVTTTTKNGRIIINVADNGQGIDSEYIDKIFDMFYRASESSQGSGLGLYIVKDTIEKLSGQISVKSEIKKGTTFSLTFDLN